MTTKNELFEKIEAQKEKLWEMADFIFDHPEYRGKEYQACDLLTKYLTDNGFSVEKSVGGYETSFRAGTVLFRRSSCFKGMCRRRAIYIGSLWHTGRGNPWF